MVDVELLLSDNGGLEFIPLNGTTLSTLAIRKTLTFTVYTLFALRCGRTSL